MTTDFSVKAMQSTLSNAVQACIERTSIIEFGIIKEIVAEGVVRVAVSAATSKEDIRILTCILVMPSGSASMIKFVPKVNDKVVVFFPRRFTSDMFDIDFKKENSEKNEIIIDPDGKGYTPFTGLAMLMNQFRESAYKNFIITEEGKLSVNLAYSEDGKKNLFTMNTLEDGSFSLQSNDVNVSITVENEVTIENENANISVKGDGSFSLQSNDVNMSVDTDNSLTVDTSNASIKISSSGEVTINAQKGKISIKNDSTSLKDILSGMLETLNSTLNTSGSATAQTVVPGQFTEQITNLGLLM